MSSTRQKRADKRALHSNPKNVTILVGNIPKVIPYKEYKEMPEYFPKEIEVSTPAVTEGN